MELARTAYVFAGLNTPLERMAVTGIAATIPIWLARPWFWFDENGMLHSPQPLVPWWSLPLGAAVASGILI